MGATVEIELRSQTDLGLWEVSISLNGIDGFECFEAVAKQLAFDTGQAGHYGVANPIVFSKPGTYDIGGEKQKTAFSAGTVYFRHVAKSEPGNSDDLRLFLDRRIEEIRKSWLDGIVKVVESPVGSYVQIVNHASPPEALSSVRLVNDPTAPRYYQVPVDETHPFRQKEVVEEVNRLLNGAKSIKPYHVFCVRQAYHIDEEPTYCYKKKYASARYGRLFVEWLIEQYNADSTFF
jgi:hypothetical protein